MKLRIWKYRGWCWLCRECEALNASRGFGSRFASQQSALNASMGHLKRWH